MRLFYILLCGIYIVSTGPLAAKTGRDTDYENFYKKARFIMLKEEKNIFKKLRDKQAKEEFIKEFWQKRDPTPGTAENEFAAEFNKRIAYANEEFVEKRAKGRGWDTERGRILLQLGFPDQREEKDFPQITVKGNFVPEKKIEKWTYFNYGLSLVFMAYKGRTTTFELVEVPAKLRIMLDRAKRELIPGSGKRGKNIFRFTPDFQKDKIIITIPVKGIKFAEENGKMGAKFRVEVYVYRNNKRIKKILEDKKISRDKAELLESENLVLSVPYSPAGKGKYYFEIIIFEELSKAKYIAVCKQKI